ncbi:MAG: 1-acyl-sn-glycerol-3-phosphate acyltransferase [Sphingomonadaceae bacterium]|uniref:lysophospholipid acyltransferase family protein n=1 Tax=Thermaurantiacus sp. TaxID=2820283 RepID=UPI00298F1470|nr:lysophospholipid acyltransferase family protein [Thermaurantiacus sp.]MCS6987142.1 1-acyl-sn-glycerol-3-phosphate acyltransferase [Sphingomonadaceae bacterium]MDW8415824.1 lysophospholipid acyltransferase family protein [Thermaurantiacus sp.]
MIALVRSLAFALVFLSGTVVLALAIRGIGPWRPGFVRRGSHLWARWFVGCARWLAGVRLEVRGRVPDGRVIVAFKHQSAFETYLTLYLFPNPAVVLKRELLDIPLWGWIAQTHGSIAVDRAAGPAALRAMLRAARARVAEGRPILIFPEGTRVPPGAAPPLKPGLYALYAALGIPVVPVALDSGRSWPKGLIKRPGVVTLAFGPAIPPGLSQAELEARVHAAINADPRSTAIEP